MFLSLSIKNSFLPSDSYIEFEEGLNVIVGKNNSGKSTTIEMLNFILFGSSALRSSVSNYDKLFEVEAVVKFSDTVYKINRTPKSSDIYSLDLETKKYSLICTGISSVNSFIKDLLSYDYKIFSLTNYCKQHDLLNLTSCTPQALVSLIEVVSGLEDSYRLMLELKSLKKEYKTRYKTLSDYERFANRDLSFEENPEFENLLETDVEILSNFKDVTLKLYDEYTYYNSLLVDLNNKYQIYKNNLSIIDNIFFNYTENKEELLTLKSEILDIQSSIQNIKKSIDTLKIPETLYEEDYLSYQERLIEKNKEYNNFLTIKKNFEDHKISCPNCQHEFSPDMSLDPDLEEEFKVAPERPQLTDRELSAQRQGIARKESYDALEALYEASIRKLEQYDSYDIKLIDLDLDNHITLENYFNMTSKFEVDFGDFYKDSKSIFYNTLKIDQPKHPDYHDFFVEAIPSLEALRDNFKTQYEESVEIKDSLTNYVNSKKEYLTEVQKLKELTGLLEEAETNENVSNLLYQVLIDTKKEIQKLSLPVLNSVASNILSDITGGERNKIEITEGFKIEVDNIDVNVIEGSAQVITNLSLRIALLNTFYKDNFLVCLFDEIDESLHEDRFEYMEECFNRLADSGYQIIAVSHKNYSSGNIINLHELNNE